MKNSNISFCEFCDSFWDSYKNNFSYEGKRALYDYLTDYEEETGEEVECDIVAICCDYTEYDNEVECAREYGFETEKDATEEEQNEEARAWLEDRTQVIDVENGGIIIQNF